jgi:hypothetical protein
VAASSVFSDHVELLLARHARLWAALGGASKSLPRAKTWVAGRGRHDEVNLIGKRIPWLEPRGCFLRLKLRRALVLSRSPQRSSE